MTVTWSSYFKFNDNLFELKYVITIRYWCKLNDYFLETLDSRDVTNIGK